jgi:hypothetical protein
MAIKGGSIGLAPKKVKSKKITRRHQKDIFILG